jgi:hypothetical protein
MGSSMTNQHRVLAFNAERFAAVPGRLRGCGDPRTRRAPEPAKSARQCAFVEVLRQDVPLSPDFWPRAAAGVRRVSTGSGRMAASAAPAETCREDRAELVHRDAAGSMPGFLLSRRHMESGFWWHGPGSRNLGIHLGVMNPRNTGRANRSFRPTNGSSRWSQEPDRGGQAGSAVGSPGCATADRWTSLRSCIPRKRTGPPCPGNADDQESDGCRRGIGIRDAGTDAGWVATGPLASAWAIHDRGS